MAKVCKDINEWVEEEVTKPVYKWVKKTKKKCKKKKCNWWTLCLNKLLCWLVAYFVQVVTWVVEKVGKWVVRTVCEIIAITVDLIIDIFVGLYDIFVGIFTWDWARVWDGLVRLIGGIIEAAFGYFRIFALGDTIDYIRDEVNESRLRKYVKKLLKKKYKEEQLEEIFEALGIEYGAFGFRIAAKVLRTYVDSDYTSGHGSPDLYQWHNDPNIDLDVKEMAGYKYSSFWRRFRPEVVAESGGFSESDMDEYIQSGGLKGKKFNIYCMSKNTLQTKLNTASEKGLEIGLKFKWRTDKVQVKKPEYVRHEESSASLVNFLADGEIAGRHRKSVDLQAAISDLCLVLGAGVFFYTDKLNGISAHLFDHPCLDGKDFPGSNASGVSFRDRLPDIVWKYVPIHEIGHYFGLCHVNGINRIMFSPANNSWWKNGWLLPEYIYLSGGPVFTFDEAKSVWDYIVEHFPYSCLSKRAS